MPFKNKNYFTLDNLSKYGNITLKLAGRYFYLLVTIIPKNRAILVQKLGGEKNLSKSVFGYFKTKKKSCIFWEKVSGRVLTPPPSSTERSAKSTTFFTSPFCVIDKPPVRPESLEELEPAAVEFDPIAQLNPTVPRHANSWNKL